MKQKTDKNRRKEKVTDIKTIAYDGFTFKQTHSGADISYDGSGAFTVWLSGDLTKVDKDRPGPGNLGTTYPSRFEFAFRIQASGLTNYASK